jgi:hypothetical protein
MTFDRTISLQRVGHCYGGGLLPRLVVSRAIAEMFGPYPTVVCYIALTWRGLQRFSL